MLPGILALVKLIGTKKSGRAFWGGVLAIMELFLRLYHAGRCKKPTRPSGTIRRLTARAAQNMLERYENSFSPQGLAIHKLRHTFATKFH